MPFFDPIRIGASGAADTAFTIDRSLRFNDDDTAYLYRTQGTPSSDKIGTYSTWFKLANLGIDRRLRMSFTNGSNYGYLRIHSDNTLQFYVVYGGSVVASLITTQVFRDVSAWYHVVLAVDTTQATASDRVKIYLNGTQITSFSTETYFSQNQVNSMFSASGSNQSTVGSAENATVRWDGYLAEVNNIDGQQLTPSSFGETNSDTGQWNPIDTSSLTFGTNGFRLQFADNSGTTATTLGKDTSGNSNNFTPSNFATGDAVKDSPTNNFATLNVLSKSSGVTTQEGNLYAQGSSAWRNIVADFHMSSGKWYWEIYIKQVGTAIYGIMPATRANGRQDFYADIYTGTYSDEWGYRNNGYLYNSASANTSWGDSYTTGDILSFALDMDNGTLDIKKNNSATGSQITGISTTKEYRAAFTYFTSGTKSNINFGQDSTFAGQKTAQGNTDGNGQGDFYYAPPSGYKALCSANLPDPTILLPNKHFDNLLWTGDGNDNRNITGLNFQPDWVWIKERSSTSGHVLTDSVRGIPAVLESNTTGPEDTSSGAADIVQSFNSDGFQVGTSGRVNQSGQTNVGWNWNAGDTDGKTYAVTVVSDSGNKYRFDGFGTSAVTLDLAEGGTYVFDWSDSSAQGHPIRFSTTSDGTHGGGSEYTTGVTKDDSAYKTTITVAASTPQLYYYCQNHSGMGGAINTNSTLGSSNFDGSVQTVVKANPTAGFSIITYTGTGSSTTVGHGLGVKPDSIIIKRRDSTDNWMFYHKGVNAGVDPEDYYLEINSTSGQINSTIMLNDTAPTSTSVTIGSDPSVNGSGATYIMYCFSEVGSYSKVSKFIGNGNANGTFVFCGFRPAWVFIRSTSSGRHWVMNDSARNPHNVANKTLLSNASNAEDSGSSFQIDILSNGFKCRTDGVHVNTNAGTHVFLAFAESPFKYARAR